MLKASLAAIPKTKAQLEKEQKDKEAAERRAKEEEARIAKEARLEVFVGLMQFALFTISAL